MQDFRKELSLQMPSAKLASGFIKHSFPELNIHVTKKQRLSIDDMYKCFWIRNNEKTNIKSKKHLRSRNIHF